MPLILPTLLGAIAGALNAALCYFKIPIEVADFDWHIVPAGAWHGGVLAFISVGFTLFFSSRRPILRWAALPLAGFLAGWLSWIFINISIDATIDVGEKSILDSFWWPFGNMDERASGLGLAGEWLKGLLSTYSGFGLVALLHYGILTLLKRISDRRLVFQILYAVASGILGSLWFWAGDDFRLWTISPLHGALWGTLVGFGIWRTF